MDATQIVVHAVLAVGPGTELTKDDLVAIFPTEVRWSNASIEKAGEAVPANQIFQDTIKVLDWSANIQPGTYELQSVGAPLGGTHQVYVRKNDAA